MKFLKKIFNINKKLKTCLKCHNFYKKNLFPNFFYKNIKNNFLNIKDFKIFKKYNFNMNFLTINIKNKNLLEILKYFKLIKIIKFLCI